MGKITRMIAGATALVAVAGIAVLAGGRACHATGNTYDTAIDAGFGQTFTSLFNEKVAGSPLEAGMKKSLDDDVRL